LPSIEKAFAPAHNAVTNRPDLAEKLAFIPGEMVRAEHMIFSTHCRRASKRENRNVDLPLVWHFIRHFVRNPASVGAIAPSSPRLARAMLRDLALAEGDNILELGPGTGSFTREIKRCLPESASYLGIECESKFVELLDRKFPDMNFIMGRAENAFELCQDAGCSTPRAIISGLPFASLCDLTRSAIVESIKRLMGPGAVFRTFQYAHAYNLPGSAQFRESMQAAFGEHNRRELVVMNLPPAFVLTWSK
jgi:phosphatidylethanolamine/phosphatidyl-N-methylethanolamine N-methyltransferase